MKLEFFKYQGTGNDFVIVDAFTMDPPELSKEQIAWVCDRRFGIGADGFIILMNSKEHDFKMKYYNSDGAESSMCGNGGRCIAAFAYHKNYISDTCEFEAIDGLHKARVDQSIISLQMKNIDHIQNLETAYVLDTGSPHYVINKENIDDLDIIPEAHTIRYNRRFSKEGINVNFIEKKQGRLKVRTYERGVEDETFSCGTGVTAAAIISDKLGLFDGDEHINIDTKGGALSVKFKRKGANSYQDIWLVGPAKLVFKGELDLLD